MSYGETGSRFSANSSYSAGIWQGVNTVFPSLPASHHHPSQQIGRPQPPTEAARLAAAGSQATLTQSAALLPHQPPPDQSKRPQFKLRKAIQPRAPLTILNELTGSGEKAQFSFLDVPVEERRRRAWSLECDEEEIGWYECVCKVADMEFIAEGHTKAEAKSYVTELAIQGVVSLRCEQNEEHELKDNEDYCPWGALASLALHKLYTDWQAQGFVLPPELSSLPDSHIPGPGPGNRGRGPAPPLDSKPALQRLNEMTSKMKVSCEYETVSEVGPPNDRVFTMSVRLKEKLYTGQAKTKKAAKQAAAAAAIEDQDNWYCPPVHHPPPPGAGEEEGGPAPPPVKRRSGQIPNLMEQEVDRPNNWAEQKASQGAGQEMRKLLVGDQSLQQEVTPNKETVVGAVARPGQQPGSYSSRT